MMTIVLSSTKRNDPTEGPLSFFYLLYPLPKDGVMYIRFIKTSATRPFETAL